MLAGAQPGGPGVPGEAEFTEKCSGFDSPCVCRSQIPIPPSTAQPEPQQLPVPSPDPDTAAHASTQNVLRRAQMPQPEYRALAHG
jgi:hypothetical protein